MDASPQHIALHPRNHYHSQTQKKHNTSHQSNPTVVRLPKIDGLFLNLIDELAKDGVGLSHGRLSEGGYVIMGLILLHFIVFLLVASRRLHVNLLSHLSVLAILILIILGGRIAGVVVVNRYTTSLNSLGNRLTSG